MHYLLSQNSYKGPEHEEEMLKSGVQLYTFKDLLENIQASEEELKKELHETMAFQMNGWFF